MATINSKELPKLLDGWEWRLHLGQPHNGVVPSSLAACLLTPEQDCFVYLEGGSLKISTGIAPVEIISAVLEARNYQSGSVATIPSVVRVDFFKASGKWYTTETVDMGATYQEPLLDDAVAKALFNYLKKPSKPGGVCELRLSEMTAVILDPFHEHNLPVMLRVAGCTQDGYNPRI